MGQIEEAKEILENLNKKIEESKQVLERHERIIAENIISGEASAGAVPPTVNHEDEVKERVNKMLAHTGMKI
jgi:hypothetical protein